MSVLRFLAAASTGALLCYWAIFLFAAYVGTGTLLWDGRAQDGFSPAYFASLYGPPLAAVVLTYLALRKDRVNSNA